MIIQPELTLIPFLIPLWSTFSLLRALTKKINQMPSDNSVGRNRIMRRTSNAVTFLVYTYFLCMLCYNRFLNHWIILALFIINVSCFGSVKEIFLGVSEIKKCLDIVSTGWAVKAKCFLLSSHVALAPEHVKIQGNSCKTEYIHSQIWYFAENLMRRLVLRQKYRPGPFFSEAPRTFRARKPSCQTAIHLFSKADLLTCF